MVRVSIRVSEEKRERWKEHASENAEYESLTHLIELAVQREINGLYDAGSGGSGGTGYSPEVTNAELHDTLRQLHRDVKNISSDMSALSDEVGQDAVPKVRAFFERLPEREADAVTPQQVADGMEFTEVDDAREALERLNEETGRVKTTTIANETHYYRDV